MNGEEENEYFRSCLVTPCFWPDSRLPSGSHPIGTEVVLTEGWGKPCFPSPANLRAHLSSPARAVSLKVGGTLTLCSRQLPAQGQFQTASWRSDLDVFCGLVLCFGLEGGLCLHTAFCFPEFFSKSTLTTAVHFHFSGTLKRKQIHDEGFRESVCVCVCVCVRGVGRCKVLYGVDVQDMTD